MQNSKVKEKLSSLSSAGGLLSKVNAVLRPTGACAGGASEQAQESQPTETMVECMAHRLELELTRAKAEESAYRARQRMM